MSALMLNGDTVVKSESDKIWQCTISEKTRTAAFNKAGSAFARRIGSVNRFTGPASLVDVKQDTPHRSLAQALTLV
jgi:hypothetical protein